MRSGASVSQLLAVNLLPRAARISTSRYLVGFWVLSVTKKTPQRSIQTSPGSGRASQYAQCAHRRISGRCEESRLTHTHTSLLVHTSICNQAANLPDGPSGKVLAGL